MKTGSFNFSGFGRRVSASLRSLVAAFYAVPACLTGFFTSLALLGGLSSCTFDDTSLKDSIDDLTSRVEALEDFQEQVQGDIASLQDIISKLNSSVTVNNVVDNGDGSWTINFSDGTSVTIRNGQDGEDGLTPPSITVVEEDGTYYWAYENADGTTDFILDDDGNKIPVSGEAPQVRINEDGYWEISSDGGKTWENTNVKAEGGSGESIFSDVTVKDGYMYLTLADGTEIRIPLTAELAFDFGTGGSVLYFAAGESKTLDYTMSGAETYTITKPDGWRASIDVEGLVITAPAAENTFAETEGVVSVILFGANGQSFLAEQSVKIGEAVQDNPGKEFGIETVLIKAGTFMMGSPVTEPGRSSYETQHEVTLTKDFYMSIYEITNSQFADFLNANNVGEDGEFMTENNGLQQIVVEDSWDPGCVWNGDGWEPAEGKSNHPVTYVSWDGAYEYARWAGGTLPTEAQWEYACRAGSTTAWCFGDDPGPISDYGWYFEISPDGTQEVGRKLPNAWGLYDMHGNVHERCLDSWDGGTDYSPAPVTDPLSPNPGLMHSMRGGSWVNDPYGLRSAYRWNGPDNLNGTTGFRIIYPVD